MSERYSKSEMVLDQEAVCPTCDDERQVFYETDLRMVPCPKCCPNEHEGTLR